VTARFTGPLVIEETGYERWKVAKPFKFISSTGLVVAVDAGFETDLASIPAIAQSLVSKLGYWTQPAIVHDLLYYRHRTELDDTIPRLQADDILLEGIKLKAAEYSVPNVERRDWLIYGAVRAGGLSSWETPDERQERLEMLNEHITDE
jgi:hypothetical protein